MPRLYLYNQQRNFDIIYLTKFIYSISFNFNSTFVTNFYILLCLIAHFVMRLLSIMVFACVNTYSLIYSSSEISNNVSKLSCHNRPKKIISQKTLYTYLHKFHSAQSSKPLAKTDELNYLNLMI